MTLGSGPVRVLLDAGTFRRPRGSCVRSELKLRLVIGRSLAGRRLSVEMAATGDDHAEQAFVAGGAIAVRRADGAPLCARSPPLLGRRAEACSHAISIAALALSMSW